MNRRKELCLPDFRKLNIQTKDSRNTGINAVRSNPQSALSSARAIPSTTLNKHLRDSKKVTMKTIQPFQKRKHSPYSVNPLASFNSSSNINSTPNALQLSNLSENPGNASETSGNWREFPKTAKAINAVGHILPSNPTSTSTGCLLNMNRAHKLKLEGVQNSNLNLFLKKTESCAVKNLKKLKLEMESGIGSSKQIEQKNTVRTKSTPNKEMELHREEYEYKKSENNNASPSAHNNNPKKSKNNNTLPHTNNAAGAMNPNDGNTNMNMNMNIKNTNNTNNGNGKIHVENVSIVNNLNVFSHSHSQPHPPHLPSNIIPFSNTFLPNVNYISFLYSF